MPTSRCVCIPRYFLFFFSSRRRHTRYWRDWSSDVCSSDLIHAGVLAHEYPGPLTKVLAYGLAGAVSYSRVRGRQHFPSDVFVGGMMGNLVAQEIYARHHDTELGGAAWRSLGEIVRGDGGNSPSRSGSPYGPLDSWVYPPLDRLAAQ